MRTDATVMRVLRPLEVDIHLARLRCLSRVVTAALVGGRLALTQLGRALPGTAKTKHAIKRVDVLLGNPRLGADLDAVQRFLAAPIAEELRPVLLIDWTDISEHWTSLVATLVVEGRGVTLCWEVCSRRQQNSPRIEALLLKRIARLLHPKAKPILVADAGFRGPWFRKVRAQGWDFIARVRGRVFVKAQARSEWHHVKYLWPQARARPTDLGEYSISRLSPVQARLVAMWTKRAKKKPTYRVGRRKKRNIQGAREPWILATSLETLPARAVIAMYRLRMRIELTFRDQKCTRFGLGLGDIRTRKPERARAYMLLAALAHFVAISLGAIAERSGLASDFQANTVRKRRVLSLARLGREVLSRVRDYLPEFAALGTTPAFIPKCGDP